MQRLSKGNIITANTKALRYIGISKYRDILAETIL